MLLATGTPNAARLGVPGEELDGIDASLDFLRSVKLGEAKDFGGKQVAVIGGGNVAIDAARSALRLGAAAVHMVSLESRTELPAHEWEVEEALGEGVILHDSWGIAEFRGDERVTAVALKRCTAVFDANGAFSPQYDESETDELACDAVIVAIGMRPDTDAFAGAVQLNRNGSIAADPATLQTAEPYVFAAGDVVMGPSMIVDAVGQGRRAAFAIDRWLRGEDVAAVPFDDRLPVADHASVLARQRSHSRSEPLAAAALAAEPSPASPRSSRRSPSRRRWPPPAAASTAGSARSATSASPSARRTRSPSTCASRSSTSRWEP